MLSTPAAQDLPVVLASRVWRDTRWVGSIAGHATTPDLLAGAILSADQKRSITRIYAAACADLAQSTLGGLLPRSAEWEHWFAGLESAFTTFGGVPEKNAQVTAGGVADHRVPTGLRRMAQAGVPSIGSARIQPPVPERQYQHIAHPKHPGGAQELFRGKLVVG